MRALCFTIAFLILCVGLANAHSFYDPWCCNENDCKELEDGEVQALADGYHYRSWVVPYNSEKIRPSGNNAYHACEYPTGTLRCFYVPPGGV